MAGPRFRTLAHTADLRLAAWGRDEAELIANAVVGACTVALGRAPGGPVRTWAVIEPWPAQLAGKVVSAVNQALFHLYLRREPALAFRGDDTSGQLGFGALRPGLEPEVEIKAATFHALEVRRRGGALRVVLTLDL